MITPTQIQVYNWFEIQDELCKLMEIKPEQFRNYHEIIGGKYKDFWHVCLETIVPEGMQNDTIVNMFHWEDADDYFEETWKNEVLIAWNTFLGMLNIDVDSGIYVKFSW